MRNLLPGKVPFLPLALLILSVVSCQSEREAVTTLDAGTPVILISIDTLRADRLPAYGYAGVETPAIDSLRRDSILFERAWSQVPLTLPSHASLLTGALPPRHGVRDNIGYQLHPDESTYLPHVLRNAGYATGAAVSSFVLRAATGLGEGFDFFDDFVSWESGDEMGDQQRSGAATLEIALNWLESVEEQPFFLLFHIYEPHSPYEPPEPYASRYASAYDGEVALSDDIVGRLLAELRLRGLYDRSLIVLLSDHGEALGEHGEEVHGILLHREVMQVPLMMKLPNSRLGGTTSKRAVGLVDIPPTILSLLGLEVPQSSEGSSDGGFDGEMMLGKDDPDASPRRVYSESYYSRLHFGWSPLTSLSGSRFRFIQSPNPEIYDLEADFAETENILQSNRPLYGELKQEMESFDQAFKLPSEQEDSATRERLAALGYLGSTAAPASGPLPDPKTRLAVLEELKQALLLVGPQTSAEAAKRLRSLLEREPQMVEAWENLAKAQQFLGDLNGALASYEEALQLSGGAPNIALPTAAILFRMGRLEEAKNHAELALPVQKAAWGILAQIALKQDDLESAEEYVRQSVAFRGTRVEPLVTQAQLLLRQERLEETIEVTRTAEREFGDRQSNDVLRGLWFVRGSAYAQLGEGDQAAEAFERSIDLFPNELAAYTHLALLYALEGRAPAAGNALQRMVEANPTPRAYAEAVRSLRVMGDEKLASALLSHARSRWPDSAQLARLSQSE